ncbi:MAG: hypothetical protein HN413_10225 [Chloroflexi bacterium]|jgi:hypothetical protein|nr:hypothetical protein [Chloroflexota bacterium]
MKNITKISHKALPLLVVAVMALSSIAAAAPNGFTADLAVTDIYHKNQPHGQFHARIANHGPGTLSNVQVTLFCGYDSIDKNTGKIGPSKQKTIKVKLSLSPGQTQEVPTGLNYDTSVYNYQVGCEVKVGFNDPNKGNNFRSESLKTAGGNSGGSSGNAGKFTADIAVTDIYPGNQPHGQFHVRITNRGPGTLQNVKVNVTCSSERTDKNNGQLSSGGNRNFAVNLNLSPGQTQDFATGLKLDTTIFDYLVGCQVKPDFNDPNSGNNVYSEQFH